MRKFFFSFFAACLLSFNLAAETPRPDEGMWLPMFVDRLNWTDIQEMGLRLTPEELYSINQSSLKDAIVGLAAGSAPNGYFCTGEVVSEQGLVFTNHHCGYDVIQNHSTIEHDYLTDGFWAMSLKEELSNPNLTASFLVRMEDLTQQVVSQLNDTMTADERRMKIKEITDPIKKEASQDGKYDVVVKNFFKGNEYYMFVYETFKDVRLVGAPPSAIGKFGGDTDNWMWPRHTGDFSIFRIYSAPDGSPAEYSENNVPLKPRHHLPISLKGYEKDDYAMIWGFPGSTDRYRTASGIDYALEYFNPIIIEVFGKVLEIMKTYMDSDPALRIEYASDYASIANTWKYFIGQTKGLKKNDVKGQKTKIENDFTAWANANPDRKERYGSVLGSINEGYAGMSKIVVPFYYVAMGQGNIDVLNHASQTMQLAKMLAEPKNKKTEIAETSEALKLEADASFAGFNPAMDKDMLKALLKMIKTRVNADQLPDIYQTIDKKFKGCSDSFVDELFETSIFACKDAYTKFLDKPTEKTLEKDLAYQLSQSFSAQIGKFKDGFSAGQAAVEVNMRSFIAGLREMNPQKKYYPDANSTMRFTYGSIQDYYPADAIHYDFVTTTDGILEKEDPSNEEFIVPAKLKELIDAKDFGQYGKDGELITCFLSTNDITGGNSGSPVINGNGELIGIAFDGNWEAMSGDIAFEPKLQRTINVDIRYVLFIIDKYAGAKNLINELTLRK